MRGTVWARAVFHKRYRNDFPLDTPYIVAVIELDEQVRLYANLASVPATSSVAGTRVRGAFVDGPDSEPHLIFEMDPEGTSIPPHR